MADGFTITNTHNIEKISIPVEKVWEYETDEQAAKMSESVTFILTSSSEEQKGETVELNKANSWEATFDDLLKYNDSGEEIQYTITEDLNDNKFYVQEGDAVEGEDGKVTITNKFERPDDTLDIDVTKKWEDDSNRDGIRPESIDLKLNGDSTKVSAEWYNESDLKAKLDSEGNEWTYKFKGLPVYDDNGDEIKYNLEEVNVPESYISTLEGNMKDVFTVTNTHTPTKRKITVTKVWSDSDDHDKKRPKEIKVQLYADNKPEGEAVELNESNSWSYTWTELDKNENIGNVAQEINYTVEEVEIPEGYEKNVTGSMTENVIEVNYYYIKKAKVIVQHIDKFTRKTLEEVDKQTGGKGDSTEKINGHEDDAYKTEEKTFDNYEIVKVEYPNNTEGKMTKEVIEVKYYYIQKTKVIVEHINRSTGKKLTEDTVLEGHEGDKYEVFKKYFEGLTLYTTSGNIKGKMTKKDILVTFYYTIIPGANPGPGTNPGSGINPGETIKDKVVGIGKKVQSGINKKLLPLVDTGDNSIILIRIIIVVISANLLQIKIVTHARKAGRRVQSKEKGKHTK